jgi:hypothetical protein
MEGTSIFEVLIGDGRQVSSTTPCERASGSSADQLFEADYDHMVGEATCTWCRVESAARLHHAVGRVGESGDEFSGAESFQGAEGFPTRYVIQSWHATNFDFRSSSELHPQRRSAKQVPQRRIDSDIGRH